MRKRSQSAQELQYAAIDTVLMARLPQKKVQNQNHHVKCPIPKPPIHESKSKRSSIENNQKIKEFSTPILKDLKIMISSLLDSSNRLLQYIDKEKHMSVIKLYNSDRKNLITYINTIVVRKLNIENIKKSSQKDKEKRYINNPKEKQQHLPRYINKPHFQSHTPKKQEKKRCLTHSPAKNQRRLQAHEEKINKNAIINEQSYENQGKHNKKSQKFTKLYTNPEVANQPEWKQLAYEVKKQIKAEDVIYLTKESSILNPDRTRKKMNKLKQKIARMKDSLTYVELMVSVSIQIIQEFLRNTPSQLNSSTGRQQIKLLLPTLNNVIKHINSQKKQDSSSDIFNQIKEYIESLILQINVMQHKALSELQLKTNLIEEVSALKNDNRRSKRYEYDEVHEKINRSISEIHNLQEQLQKKDEIIEYYKSENMNLNDELKSMEDMFMVEKEKIRNLTLELEEVYEKFKAEENIVQEKEEYISELIEEKKEKQLLVRQRFQQLQYKEAQWKEILHKIQKNQGPYEPKGQQITVFLHQNQNLKKQISELHHKIDFAEQENHILQKKIESMFAQVGEERNKLRQTQDRNDYLQQQSKKLYIQISQMDNPPDLQHSKRLQQQNITLRHLSIQANKKIQFYKRKVQELTKIIQYNDEHNQVREQDNTLNKEIHSLILQQAHEIDNKHHDIQTIKEEPESDSFIKIQEFNQKENQQASIELKEDAQKQNVEQHQLLSQQFDHNQNTYDQCFDILQDMIRQPKLQDKFSNYEIVVKNQHFDPVAILQTIGEKFEQILHIPKSEDNHLKTYSQGQSGIYVLSNMADKDQSQQQSEKDELQQRNTYHLNAFIQDDDFNQQSRSSISKMVNYDDAKKNENDVIIQHDSKKKSGDGKGLRKMSVNEGNQHKDSKNLFRQQSIREDNLTNKKFKGNQAKIFKNVLEQFEKKAEMRMSGQEQYVGDRIDYVEPISSSKVNKPGINRNFYINYGVAYDEIKKQSHKQQPDY